MQNPIPTSFHTRVQLQCKKNGVGEEPGTEVTCSCSMTVSFDNCCVCCVCWSLASSLTWSLTASLTWSLTSSLTWSHIVSLHFRTSLVFHFITPNSSPCHSFTLSFHSFTLLFLYLLYPHHLLNIINPSLHRV